MIRRLIDRFWPSWYCKHNDSGKFLSGRTYCTNCGKRGL